MWPEFGSLPPGIVPLILILGGLAFSIPVTAATMLRPPRARPPARTKRRAILVNERAPGEGQLDFRQLPPVDAALELVHRTRVGDPRIVYSDGHRKLVSVRPRNGEATDAYREEVRAVIEDAFSRVLHRQPTVTTVSSDDGRCEFLVQY